MKKKNDYRLLEMTILYYVGTGQDMEDTLGNVASVEEALRIQGHPVRTIEVNSSNWRRAINSPGDVFFNFVEDENYILYYKITDKLINMGKTLVGNKLGAERYGTNKARLKKKMRRIGVSTPAYRIIDRRFGIPHIRGLEFPVIIKPSREHAGIGISQDSVVIDQQELEERAKYLFDNFPGKVVAEEYIDGREIQVTVIGNGRKLVVLPPAEIEFGGEYNDNWSIYSFKSKWEKDSWEYWDARVKAPARLTKGVLEKIETMCKIAFRAFGCADIARFDLRLDDDNCPYIVDMNMCPSINKHDDQDATVKSIEAMGWEYTDFVEKIIQVAHQRVKVEKAW